MQKFFITIAAVTAMFASGSAIAQTSATQKFTVRVPTHISITSPTNVSIDHDETDNNQAFPAQQWIVRGNTGNGVSVSFATIQAFTHTTNSSFKRDVNLSLSVASSSGPAGWTVTKATDATDYGSSDELATVQATSNGIGEATFDLAVTFITDTFGSFAAGDYETTVTGTVSAN